MMESDYSMPALSTTYPTTAMTSSQQQRPQQRQQQQQQPSSDSPVPLKRTRAKRSCDFCRQRKSKCDADISSPCTNCKAWGYTCEFQTVRKKRGPPSVYVDNLEKRCKKMESLLMQLTNTTIKDLEQNDFRPTHQRNISDPSVVSDSSSDDDDDDDDDEGGGGDDNDEEASIVNRLDRLEIQDYDSIKYTGQSAGLELLDQDLFKSKPYIAWPGRRDMVLQMMADDQLMVVRTEKSATTGKLDTRLDVGLSITSALPDMTASAGTATVTPFSTATGGVTFLGATTTTKSTNKPSKSLVDQMVKLYFTHLHSSLPIINKTRFLQLYHSQSSTLPKVLVQAILTLSFRFAAHHSLLPTNKTTTTTTTATMEYHSDYYFRKVMKQLRDTARSRLCHVQAGLLVTLYLDMDGDDVASLQWHTLGKAIRMAQDLGLHRSCENWQLPPSEIETRHRVFYACYALDRWIGARAGKPLTILDRDFDTTLPSMYEVIDTNKNALSKDAGAGAGAGDGKPIYRAFVLWVKLSEILGRVLKALYAPSAKKSNSNANLDDPMILVVFDRRLRHWQSLLEETVDGTTLPLVQSVSLKIYYNTVLLLLRRPFLSLSKYLTLEQLVTESRGISLNVASDIFDLVKQNNILLSTTHPATTTNDNTYFGSSYLLPTCYIYAMFLSSLAHLAIVLQDRTSVEKRQALWGSIDLIQSHHRLCASRQALEILHMLITLHEIQTIENTTNSSNDLKSIKMEKTYDDEAFYLDDASFYITPGQQQRDTTTSLSVFHHHPPHQQQHQQQQYMIPAPTVIESEMPKTHWFQRYVNTSVVGGVPTEIQHQVQSDLSQQQLLLQQHHQHQQHQQHQQQQQQQQSHYSLSSYPYPSPAPANTPMTLPRSVNNNNNQSMFYSPYMPSLTSSSSASPSMSCSATTTPHYPGSAIATITTTTSTHPHQPSLSYEDNHHHHHHTSDTLLLAPTSVLHHQDTAAAATTTTTTTAAGAAPAASGTLSPSNLNWHDWQYYVNQHQHHQNNNHAFTTPSSSN